MKPLTVSEIARMIERRVSYFNGWAVEEEIMRNDCKKAALAIMKAHSKRCFQFRKKEDK